MCVQFEPCIVLSQSPRASHNKIGNRYTNRYDVAANVAIPRGSLQSISLYAISQKDNPVTYSYDIINWWQKYFFFFLFFL